MTTTDNTLTVRHTVDARQAVIWRCWTEGNLLKRWFTPAPWTVPEVDLHVRPGGRMNVTMAGP